MVDTAAILLSKNSCAYLQNGDSRRKDATGASSIVGSAPSSMTSHSLRQTYARIDRGVYEIDDKIYQDEQYDRDHQVGHNYRSIQLTDRIDEQLAHSGIGENRFSHDREGYQ